MNKMRRNLIKIRSCAIFSWFKFSSYFKVAKRLRFRWLIHSVRGVKSKLVCDLKSLRLNYVIMQVVFPAAVIILVPVH